MPHPRPLPDGLGDEFSCSAAIAAGATRGRLRAKDLDRPFRGMRQHPESSHDPDDGPLAPDRTRRRLLLRRAHAYHQVMEPGAFYAGRTAAVIHGLPLDASGDLEVGVFTPRRAPRRHGIRGFHVAEHLAAVEQRFALPVTTPAATWAMLARECSIRELVRVGDAIVRVPRISGGTLRPDRRLATIEQLRHEAAAGSRRGAPKLREALELIRVGSMSPLETDFRLDASSMGLPEPELDVEVRDARGRLIGISEFVYREFRTIVEVEGDHHRIDARQWDRDIEKYAAYVAEGWEVVRLTSRHIRGRDARAATIVAEVLRRHGWRR